jgi:hypothetical protein
MDKFIFCDEDAGNGGKETVEDESFYGKGDKENKTHAEKNAARIDRVSYPFPFGKTSFYVEIAFVKEDHEGLEDKREDA